MIVCRTPMRISLIGGGTDLPSFYEKHPGMCISFAITKYVYIILNEKFDGGYRISYSETENVSKISHIKHPLFRRALMDYESELDRVKRGKGLEIVSIADIPGLGSGLGSSSTFMVGLYNALRFMNTGDEFESPKSLARYAYSGEKMVNPNIGMQDHCAAAFGGFNKFQFNKEGLDSKTEVIPKWDGENPWSWNELYKYMLLLWTGVTRKSDDILKAQREGFDSGRTLAVGEGLVSLAKTFYTDLINGKIEKAAQYITAGWELKKSLAPDISNPVIESWMDSALQNGAWGGKLLGAGGGGFLFFFAPPNTHDRIIKATGLRKVDFSIDYEGSVIIKRQGWGEF